MKRQNLPRNQPFLPIPSQVRRKDQRRIIIQLIGLSLMKNLCPVPFEGHPATASDPTLPLSMWVPARTSSGNQQEPCPSPPAALSWIQGCSSTRLALIRLNRRPQHNYSQVKPRGFDHTAGRAWTVRARSGGHCDGGHRLQHAQRGLHRRMVSRTLWRESTMTARLMLG